MVLGRGYSDFYYSGFCGSRIRSVGCKLLEIRVFGVPPTFHCLRRQLHSSKSLTWRKTFLPVFMCKRTVRPVLAFKVRGQPAAPHTPFFTCLCRELLKIRYRLLYDLLDAFSRLLRAALSIQYFRLNLVFPALSVSLGSFPFPAYIGVLGVLCGQSERLYRALPISKR